jgi:hypothetical protein
VKPLTGLATLIALVVMTAVVLMAPSTWNSFAIGTELITARFPTSSP